MLGFVCLTKGEMIMKAYKHWEDGKQWLRVIDTKIGHEWDEPITGWVLSINLINGETLWKHADGRVYHE
jgi:hypothetical protein